LQIVVFAIVGAKREIKRREEKKKELKYYQCLDPRSTLSIK